jgi:predicted dehydrogenase
MRRVKVGIIGCGNISEVYFRNLQSFPNTEVVACADLDVERAKARANQFGIAKACSVDELLADADVEIVVNLTIPKAHADVCQKALAAGKHVHVEKPLAINLADGLRTVELAKEKGLLVGGAPDTFLGGGIQTCRKLIDDGWIGQPIAATAFMMCHGHESWHPDPAFYYQAGGGPMFDMGPYYITALVNLIGPVRRVTGSAQVTFPTRTITSKPKYGQEIPVETATHVAGVFDFASGAVGTIITSFDVWHARLPLIEIYGTEGTLSVPDPNGFGGPISIRRRDAKEWTEVALTHGFTENGRGLAVADMADAILQKRPHRASGALALHALEVMQGFQVASDEGRHYEMTTTCERPVPLPVGFSMEHFF